MRKSIVTSLLLAAIFALSTAAQAQESSTPAPKKSGKKRIAVIPFEAPNNLRDTAVGTGVADMITTTLVSSSRFDVIERMQLEKLVSEQKLAASGLVDPATASQAGKLSGAELILTGKITEFGVKEQNAGGALGVISGLGGVSIKNSTARVALDVRLVDCQTGKVLVAYTGIGEEKQSGIALAGTDFHRFVAATKFETKEWTESRIGKACRKAADSVVGKIAELFALEANVLAVIGADTGKSVILSLGNFDGIKSGDEFVLFQEQITRDDAGEIVWTDRKQIGTAKATDIQNERCKAEILTGAAVVKKGDKAIPIKTMPKPDETKKK